jgi:N-acetylglucosamine kinase-like BadF-type ATPase
LVAVGEQKARDALYRVITQDHYDCIVAGMAGADRPWVRKFWETALAPFADRVLVVGDYQIAWDAFTEGTPGAVAIFGTGSIFYGENHQWTARIGGYGWKVGDVGSGIALGTAAVRAALASWEGWGPTSTLTDAVGAWSGAMQTNTLLDYLYDPNLDWRSVSDLAGAVFSHAQSGDEAAEMILRRQEHDILRQWDILLEKIHLPKAAPIGLMGGLASPWRERLNAYWQQRQGAPLLKVTREPVDGAARWAVRLGRTQRG